MDFDTLLILILFCATSLTSSHLWGWAGFILSTSIGLMFLLILKRVDKNVGKN